MVSHMATSYEPQTTKVNEELAPETSLNLTLTQRPHDEDPKPQRCVLVLKLNPFKLGIIASFQTFAPW